MSFDIKEPHPILIAAGKLESDGELKKHEFSWYSLKPQILTQSIDPEITTTSSAKLFQATVLILLAKLL